MSRRGTYSLAASPIALLRRAGSCAGAAKLHAGAPRPRGRAPQRRPRRARLRAHTGAPRTRRA